MKTYLLPRDGQFYKANMHSHTTLSDGKFTPEEVKCSYKEHGYSIFAYTEHTHYHDLRHLADEAFLPLPSYEIALVNRNRPAYLSDSIPPLDATPGCYSPAGAHHEAIHLNLFAKEPDTAHEIDLSGLKGMPWPDNINEAIRLAKDAGFFVCFNHPHWSLNRQETYDNLQGLDALELINGAAFRSSGLDFVPHLYREMAWNQKRLVAIAGDDNHEARHFFQAWTMIKAPELSHAAVMSALEAGHCYASAGPEIHELYVEDGVLHVTTSEASGIYFGTAGRRKQAVLQDRAEDAPVTHAEFPLKSSDMFFHVMVKDLRGRPAMTQIYYLNDYDFLEDLS